MQKWVDDNILIYLTHNESKSGVAKRFLRTLDVKSYKTMTANKSISWLFE